MEITADRKKCSRTRLFFSLAIFETWRIAIVNVVVHECSRLNAGGHTDANVSPEAKGPGARDGTRLGRIIAIRKMSTAGSR
ncbi:unnamed protein product [Heterotrigona itama]|uniref:Uncharacterized protein n=1 Tax=Heterotrigona itama TaxID=395501 RepID=A0A6V7H4J9_9HYME|nr:unnamed protein product [Heterotrigona itama]